MKKEDVGKAKQAEKQADVRLRKLALETVEVTIEGMSPLIVHNFSQEAQQMIAQRQEAGGRSRHREARNPEAEYEAAKYKLADGRDAMKVTAIKAATINAAGQDLGVPKTVVRKALLFIGDEADLVAIQSPGAKMRTDMVRLARGVADLRYRPSYDPWVITFWVRYDSELLSAETLLNLIERAGFGVGIGDWRPEKDGDFGRFRVKRG